MFSRKLTVVKCQMGNYAVHSSKDNALFQLHPFYFSHQWESFGECLNRMIHNKCHWYYKSFMMPQATKLLSLYIKHPAVSVPRDF